MRAETMAVLFIQDGVSRSEPPAWYKEILHAEK